MKKYLVKLSYGYMNDTIHTHELTMLLTHKEKQVIFNTIKLVGETTYLNRSFFIDIEFEEVD